MHLFQFYRVELNNVPPVTLAVLALNVYLFLFPAAPPMKACVSVQQVYWLKDWRRLLLWPLHHLNRPHLVYNMASFLWKGIKLEQRLGSPWFASLLAVFSVLTGVVYLLVEAVLSELTQDQSYCKTCTVGFSGVLFALKVLSNHDNPGGVTNILGIAVPNRYTCWLELVLIQLMLHRISFVGHLSGILVGLLYTSGPLKGIMKKCADLVTPNPSNSTPHPAYYSTSGPTGYASDPAAPQAPPPYGFNLTEEPSAEELRWRRLRRFDS